MRFLLPLPLPRRQPRDADAGSTQRCSLCCPISHLFVVIANAVQLALMVFFLCLLLVCLRKDPAIPWFAVFAPLWASDCITLVTGLHELSRVLRLPPEALTCALPRAPGQEERTCQRPREPSPHQCLAANQCAPMMHRQHPPSRAPTTAESTLVRVVRGARIAPPPVLSPTSLDAHGNRSHRRLPAPVWSSQLEAQRDHRAGEPAQGIGLRRCLQIPPGDAPGDRPLQERACPSLVAAQT